MGRHGAIGSFIRIVAVIKVHGLGIGFELFDDPVYVFGIIFSDSGFDAGRIKDRHCSFSRIYVLTDGFSKINLPFKNGLDIFKEILLKASDFREIRNFVKPTEFPEMSGIVKENKEQGIGRDGKNTLDKERP
mgnify:CR=1 FL=1